MIFCQYRTIWLKNKFRFLINVHQWGGRVRTSLMPQVRDPRDIWQNLNECSHQNPQKILPSLWVLGKVDDEVDRAVEDNQYVGEHRHQPEHFGLVERVRQLLSYFYIILFIFVCFIYLDMSVKVRRDLEQFSMYGREGREGQ